MNTDVLKAIEEVKKCADAEIVVELTLEQYEELLAAEKAVKLMAEAYSAETMDTPNEITAKKLLDYFMAKAREQE